MTNKKNLGQFYTTNVKYIIENLIPLLPKNIEIIDPFAGNWDLLNFYKGKKAGYDIDPKNKETIKQDTLLNPPEYKNKWIITNPPYLARNKSKNKELYNKYNLNDLYKIALKTFIGCEGGIIILPLNFLSEETSKIREEFLSQYQILKLNIFEEQVFDDTTYTVCSFLFTKSSQLIKNQTISAVIFPDKKEIELTINEEFNFRLGADFYKIIKDGDLSISRLIKGDKPNTKIKLRAIDGGSENNRIGLEFCEEPYFDLTPNRTERTFASIQFPFTVSEENQKIIIDDFNKTLEKYRKKHHSLFLTNYRNSTSSYARKRISFDVAYKLISYLIKKNKIMC